MTLIVFHIENKVKEYRPINIPKDEIRAHISQDVVHIYKKKYIALGIDPKINQIQEKKTHIRTHRVVPSTNLCSLNNMAYVYAMR